MHLKISTNYEKFRVKTGLPERIYKNQYLMVELSILHRTEVNLYGVHNYDLNIAPTFLKPLNMAKTNDPAIKPKINSLITLGRLGVI